MWIAMHVFITSFGNDKHHSLASTKPRSMQKKTHHKYSINNKLEIDFPTQKNVMWNCNCNCNCFQPFGKTFHNLSNENNLCRKSNSYDANAHMYTCVNSPERAKMVRFCDELYWKLVFTDIFIVPTANNHQLSMISLICFFAHSQEIVLLTLEVNFAFICDMICFTWPKWFRLPSKITWHKNTKHLKRALRSLRPLLVLSVDLVWLYFGLRIETIWNRLFGLCHTHTHIVTNTNVKM